MNYPKNTASSSKRKRSYTIKLVDVEGNLLVFAVPTKFIYEQIEGTYLELFREALYEQFPDADVKYNINETYFK